MYLGDISKRQEGGAGKHEGYLKMLSTSSVGSGNNSAGTSGDYTEYHPDWSVGETGDRRQSPYLHWVAVK